MTPQYAVSAVLASLILPPSLIRARILCRYFREKMASCSALDVIVGRRGSGD